MKILPGKRDFADMIKDLEMGKLPWIFLRGTNIILKVLIKWGYGNQLVVRDVMMEARM